MIKIWVQLKMMTPAKKESSVFSIWVLLVFVSCSSLFGHGSNNREPLKSPWIWYSTEHDQFCGPHRAESHNQRTLQPRFPPNESKVQLARGWMTDTMVIHIGYPVSIYIDNVHFMAWKCRYIHTYYRLCMYIYNYIYTHAHRSYTLSIHNQ